MAYPKKGCFGKFITILVVFVLLVVGAVLVVGNLTPAQLGLSDRIVVNGKNLDELGLGDRKIFELLSVLRGLQSPNEAVVENGFTSEDAANADGIFENILGQTDGKPDYLELLQPTKFGKQMLLTLTDRELAYIFSEMASAAADSASGSELEILEELNAQIKEISVLETEDGFLLKTVLSVRVKEFIPEDFNLPFVTLPEELYFVSTNRISADDEGLLTSVSDRISVNGQSAEMSEILWNLITDSVGEELSPDAVNDAIGKAFGSILSNIGRIGTAQTRDETDPTVTGGVEYGDAGLGNGRLTLITNV